MLSRVCAFLQAASEQRPHKLSYSLSAKGDEAKAVLARLEDALKSKGITVTTNTAEGLVATRNKYRFLTVSCKDSMMSTKFCRPRW